MASGRREKIVISCVTFETVKVTAPVIFYEANRIHLIHYQKEGASEEYSAFYRRTLEILEENGYDTGRQVIEHNSKVYVFSDMLSTILKIIDSDTEQYGEACDFYINISSGSPEYTAAAVIASLMYENVIAFSVPVDRYTVADEKVREAYYENGKPVGLAKKTRDPIMIPSFKLKKPEEHLVRGLRIYRDLSRNGKKVKSPDIVRKLTEAGLWIHPSEGASKAQSDAVNYHRDFVKKWEALGWIKKSENSPRYEITEEGERFMTIFYNVDKTPGKD